MKKFIFILGGARSGKSRYAVELTKRLSRKAAFIATAASADEEMGRRIRLHRLSRPRHWKVIEEGIDVAAVLSQLRGKYAVVLIDCLGLLISNLLAKGLRDRAIERRLRLLVSAISRLKSTVILVSNEVGMGIVPDNHLARRFGDLAGLANQMMAEEADEVILMQSGIPLIIKGRKKDAEIE